MLRPQRDSSVTRMASISRAWARAIALLRSTRSLGAGGGLLENADDTMAGAPGKRAEIAFLLARLVIGADAAVDRDVSQLNPLESAPLRT